MRILPILLLACATAHAANPSFGDFNSGQFDTNGNKISLKASATVTNSTIIATNITILNSLTVSNITVTNITVQNNLTVSNLFTVNGNHNTLIVTNSLTLQTVKTNVLATTATGLVTNVNYGSGIAWDPTTLTLSASGAPTSGTNIVTLTQTSTNISQMDFALVQNGGAFKLSLTNNGYIGSPANVVTTSFKKVWLLVQQPSTGTCILQFTNGIAGFAWSEGVSPVIDTNNGSVAVFEFVSDVFTNGLAHGALTRLSKTATNL